MIDPTEDDIGRTVIYKAASGIAAGAGDEGVITSFNDRMVFVRYRGDQGSMATRRQDLTWAHARKFEAELISGQSSTVHVEAVPMLDADGDAA